MVEEKRKRGKCPVSSVIEIVGGTCEVKNEAVSVGLPIPGGNGVQIVSKQVIGLSSVEDAMLSALNDVQYYIDLCSQE